MTVLRVWVTQHNTTQHQELSVSVHCTTARCRVYYNKKHIHKWKRQIELWRWIFKNACVFVIMAGASVPSWKSSVSQPQWDGGGWGTMTQVALSHCDITQEVFAHKEKDIYAQLGVMLQRVFFFLLKILDWEALFNLRRKIQIPSLKVWELSWAALLFEFFF